MTLAEITTPEYEIYSNLAQVKSLPFDKPGATFGQFTWTLDAPALSKMSGRLRMVCLKNPELIQDFNSKNDTPSKIEAMFTLPVPYEIVPTGRFQLSRVGIEDKNAHALLYLHDTKVPDETAGNFLLFRKTGNGQWYVDEHLIVSFG